MSKTDTSLVGKEIHDDCHLTGCEIFVGVGLNITF
jgi:hypothetical protein